MKIRINPDTDELLLDDTRCLYRFDGTPFSRESAELNHGPIAEWAIAGEATCLFNWQDLDNDLGNLRRYCLARIWLPAPKPHGSTFHAGGPVLFVSAFASENGGSAIIERIYDDRNTARQVAETFGGVAW